MGLELITWRSRVAQSIDGASQEPLETFSFKIISDIIFFTFLSLLFIIYLLVTLILGLVIFSLSYFYWMHLSYKSPLTVLLWVLIYGSSLTSFKYSLIFILVIFLNQRFFNFEINNYLGITFCHWSHVLFHCSQFFGKCRDFLSLFL